MKRIILFIITSILSVNLLMADGFVVIPPLPRLPNPVPVEVKYHDVDINISHQIAHIHIDQIFKNPNAMEVEGRYIFPIPEEATISDFALYIDGEKVHGEILDADKAMRIYQDIVAQMIDPAILRYVGQDMFEARIYPFPANGERRVELDYQQLVTKDGNLYRFIYPLSTEQFSSKNLESAVIKINMKSEKPIRNVYSPSHSIEVVYKNSKEVEISWEERDVKPDKDFILYYSLAEEEVDLSFLTYKPHREEDGYFMLLASVGSEDIVSIPKDVVFVVDRSGSMRGERMEMVRDALLYCVNHLGEDDRFNIIAFSSNTENLFSDLKDVNKFNIEEARDFIDEINPRGGTNISKSLEEAFNSDFSERRATLIIFMTDGYPTVGELDPGEIVNQVEEFDKGRLFVFGIGSEDINAVLMDAMANAGRGLVDYVKDGDSLRLSISSFFNKISNPVFTDIDIDYGSIRVYDIVPYILPDIFEGQQLVITGRYRNSGRTRISLIGNRGSDKEEYSFSVNFPDYSSELDFIGRYWAMRQIGTLLQEIRLNGEKKELVDEITQLGLEFGIITPYTSYLVLEDEDMLKSFQNEEFRRLGTMDASDHISTSMRDREAFGDVSIEYSKAINNLAAGGVFETQGNIAVNYVNGISFLNERGIWKDNTYNGENINIVEYGSDEFFELLNEYPETGDYMAMGNVIFNYNGQWYNIVIR